MDKEKIILALGIVAGTVTAHEYWTDFIDTERPRRDSNNESVFDYMHRLDRIVKVEVVKYLSEVLCTN